MLSGSDESHRTRSSDKDEMKHPPPRKTISRKKANDLSVEDMQQRMVALEKLLYDLIVTQSQRERVLISHIVKLQQELQDKTDHEQQHRLQHSKQECCPGEVGGDAKRFEQISVESATKSVSTESDVQDDDLHKYDIEYEEVTLDRENSNDNLGLAFCGGEEHDNDVYVQNVEPGSVAGIDGRIVSGDEIIEIDGVDIHSRQQALQMLKDGGDKRVVTLVVARPHFKPMDRELTSPDSSSADDGKRSAYSTDSSGERTFLNRLQVQSILEEDEEEEEDESAADKEGKSHKDIEDESSGIEKDSGVGKTDESVRNEESSEQESFRETNSGESSMTKKLTPKDTVTKVRSLNKSEAVQMWVESTASPKHTNGEDLSLEMFLPPPPFPDTDDLLSVVSCDNCRHCSCGLSPTRLKKAVTIQQQLSTRVGGNSGSWSYHEPRSNNSTSSPAHSIKSEPALEWRAKRKPDGTKCIVRRPARVKMLKERANQVTDERCGLTTDDDAVSEFKGGRYWAKQERKKHFERAKARQKQKEEQQQQYKCVGGTLPNQNSKQKCILEMSRRKMMRVKGQSLLDDFTTVQELMVHGTHSKTDTKVPHHRLLAVTTV